MGGRAVERPGQSAEQCIMRQQSRLRKRNALDEKTFSERSFSQGEIES